MNNIKKVVLYSENDTIDNLEYKDFKHYGFELVQCRNKTNFINIDTHIKIIDTDIGNEETIDIIKKIRSNQLMYQVSIIVILNPRNIKYLSKYIEIGINDYIKRPFQLEELHFILTNNLKVLDEDRKYELTIENLPFPVWVNDLNGKYINVNEKFANHVDKSVNEIIGKKPEDFYDIDEVNKIYNQDKDVVKNKSTIKFEETYTEQGKKRTIHIYKTPIFNMYNEILGITGTIIDVTNLKDAEKEIKNQALTDPLTLIPNRRAFYEYIESRKGYNETAIMLIDIDDFKFINDTYGHHIGDNILREFSNKLKEVCKDSFICRLAGDEFIVIFKNKENLEIICEKAEQLLRTKSTNNNYNISVSIGIVFNDGDNNIDDILSKADIAMYKVKELGKNNYVVYTEELSLERQMKLDIENSIKRYNEENDLKLYYQPQYTKDYEIKGFEALLRWENDKYKDIPIINIIKIMEETDLIVDIGYFIMRKACEFCKKININREKPLSVSVNISAIQIMDRDFVKNIKNIVEETKVNPKYIGIEITETALLNNIEENAIKINELKDMGMEILIDDFGVGYSSISYLLELPISVIKIDKSLIDLVHSKKKYRDMIDVIVKFAKITDLKVVSEGVEYKEQLQILKEIDVDYFQGYLFNKPLKEEDVVRLISN